MYKQLRLICLFMTGTAAFAQNSELRTLENFNRIRIASNSKVYLSPGSQEVKVQSEGRLQDVSTIVKDDMLNIDGKPSVLYIKMPGLREVNISGAGDVIADSMFSTETMDLNISGNGKIIMPLQVTNLNIDVSGYGKMKLRGTASNLTMTVSGNSKTDAEELVTSNARVQVSGVSKASVDVKDTLDMKVSGVGSVYYKTEPKVITRDISGIGKYGYIQKDDADTTTVQLGKKRVVIIGSEKGEGKDDDFDIDINVGDEATPKPPKKARSHWAGIDLGFNGYFHDKLNTDLPVGYKFLELNEGKSIAVNINVWKFDIPLYKRYIMLTTGIGMSLNNYRFGTDRTLISDTSVVAASFDYKETGEQISYAKNKLAVNYITVPLLLQFNTNKLLKKSVHLGAGMLFSYKYNSHLKLVYEENGDKQKSKRRDDFNIEPFRYDATVRLGYRNYTLFGTYAISELFKEKSGPTLHPFTIGLQLAGW